MAKNTRSSKKKRTEPHMTVRELPDGLREVTVDGHTWIERPSAVESRPPAHGNRAEPVEPRQSGSRDNSDTGTTGV